MSTSDYSGTELEILDAAVNYHRWILSKFEPYLGETVAEVGAGIGSVSKLLLEFPIRRLLAFEPSQNLFPTLRRQLQHDKRAIAVNGVLHADAIQERVDSVLYVNVLEHIEDDEAELKLSHQLLRDDGRLLVFAPALNWLYSDFDRHVGHRRRYTKRGLQRVVETAGFSVHRSEYFDLAGVAPWYVNFVLLKGRPRRVSMSLYDRLVVPVLRAVERLPPPVGKNAIVIATKA
jgi:SAM-dependent methyltransferase